MTKVLIKGLGLIGSSLARAIRLNHPEVQIVGDDIKVDALEYAMQNQVATDWDQVDQMDVIILAGTVSQIRQDIQALSDRTLKPGVLITDVGSTKQTIMATAQVFNDQDVNFIGGHPMAGSHKTGVWAGRADLFENAFYFQIPLNEASAQQMPFLQDLLAGTRAKWLQVTAPQHDKIVAQISHVPHVIASALVNQTEQTFQGDPLGMRLAAGGFKSITRIASADPTMWSAILLNNPTMIQEQLRQFQAELTQVAALIDQGDRAALFDFFKQAKVKRDQLGPEKVGAIPGQHDLFINIADQVGALADVTQKISQAGISLVNIHILEIREEIDGVLQLTFASQADCDQAKQVLSDYEIVARGE